MDQADKGAKEQPPFLKQVFLRVFRLWPVMMLSLCFAPPTDTQIRVAMAAATFSLNYNPHLAAPVWSVCVDIQMFIVTPLIARTMWWLDR